MSSHRAFFCYSSCIRGRDRGREREEGRGGGGCVSMHVVHSDQINKCGERNKWKRQTTMISTERERERKNEATNVETIELSVGLCVAVCHCGLCSLVGSLFFLFICFDSFVRLFFIFRNVFLFMFSIRLKSNLYVSIYCVCVCIVGCLMLIFWWGVSVILKNSNTVSNADDFLI